MVELARDFMLLVDCITMLLGLAVLGLSIYILAAYGYFQSLVSLNTVYISLGVGAGLVLISCFGCVASRRGHKWMLTCYLFFVTACLVAQIAATILVAQYAGQINLQTSTVSGGLTIAVEQTLNNGIYSTYTSCCTGCPTPASCNNAQPFFNSTLGFCSSENVLQCTLVGLCTGDPNEQACYINPTGDLVPPLAVDRAICNTFQDFKTSTGVPLVGSFSVGACGGGNPVTYKLNFIDIFNQTFYWFIVGFSILCVVQGLNLIAASYLLCCTDGYRNNKNV